MSFISTGIKRQHGADNIAEAKRRFKQSCNKCILLGKNFDCKNVLLQMHTMT